MRLIDADRFKEYIRKGMEESVPYYKYKTTLELAKDMSEAFCDDIDAQPTVNFCGRWIPADRPPETKDGKSKYILISFENDDDVMIGKYAFGRNGKGEYIWGIMDEHIPYSTTNLKVNAWMPLPEPLRRQKEAKER